MNVLERIWDLVCAFFSGFTKGFERLITTIVGSSNARFMKKVQPKVEEINALESHYEKFSDEQLKEETTKFKERLANGETVDDLLADAFAVCREAGRRWVNMRHYDVQLIGGIVLHTGDIAEMITGEGKTLVATMPAYLNALSGKGVHIVTVNDYLARRDMEWMAPIYMGLGLTVGAIQSNMETGERQEAYSCDITYGTNNEFGFDYLRDNMRHAAWGDERYPKRDQQSQRKLNYAIIDEVDNILIDEARTPLIISGSAHDDITKYSKADKITRQLKRDVHFEVNEKDHSAHLNDEGIREAERLAGVESFYTVGNMEWPHLLDNSLKAHYLYKRDVNYVVQNDSIIIVDEHTQRLMEGRQWSDGLHQAVEAKERVKIKEETQTLATITLQNYFKLYDKISGMTGTAMTEAAEFWKIYKLEVLQIPTNRPLNRIEYPDAIYKNEKGKFLAVAEEIERVNKWDIITLKDGSELVGNLLQENEDEVTFQLNGSKNKDRIPRSKIVNICGKGRPILVGTASIEKSEKLASLLSKRGISNEVLNAKQHTREAVIVAQAGRKGVVTISTSMAGRGTDIVLGGNPETMAWSQLQDTYKTRLDVPKGEWNSLVEHIEETEGMKVEGEYVKGLGGLYIIGTERHESRRIDLQLRGRSGRQGDPGSSRFFLSLEDDLMRIFAGPWVKSILERLGMKDDEAIESRMVTRRIEAAQKKVEERNFEIRKNLLEYDEVMDEQRKRVYGYRQNILDGANCRTLIMEMIDRQVSLHLGEYLKRDFAVETFTSWAGSKLSAELESRDFQGASFENAERLAFEAAQRLSQGAVLEAIDENLPDEGDTSEWNWAALAKFANTKWNLNTRDRELKQIGRDHVADHLIVEAHKAIEKIDLSDGAQYLEPNFGMKTACEWVKFKFNVDLDPQEVAEIEVSDFVQLVFEKAVAAYDVKETEFPVLTGLSRFVQRDAGGHKRFDREMLIRWARERFDVELSIEDVRTKQREEVQAMLLQKSQLNQEQAKATLDHGHQQIEKLFGSAADDTTVAEAAGSNGQLTSMANWIKDNLDAEISTEEIAKYNREDLQQCVDRAVENHFRPEIRKLERILVLEILDEAWKNHLLTMDYLRSSVGLRGYAQVDPKVEYKREGMKMFDTMWNSVDDQVTDLIFKMENLDDDFVSSTFVEGTAIHDSAQSTSDIAMQQQEAIDGMQSTEKIEPIRNTQKRVGRNERCPCGSGKKYKNCCMRK